MKLKYTASTHAYYLDGKRCRGASSVAKVPDDPFALMQWKPRMALLGAAVQPTILTEVAASHDDKQKLNALVEKAIEHGKGTTGRDYGTAVHEIIRRHDEGLQMLPTAEVTRLRQQWADLLASYDLEVVQTEGAVVHPVLKIAGRFDCVVRHLPTRRHFVGDVKTGVDADKYLHAHAIQLHVYASAPFIATGIPSGDTDFETTEFAEMLPVDQEIGFVFHLPMDGEPKVVPVDIAAGGECFREIVLPTLAWRNRSNLRAKWEPKAATRPDPHAHGKAFHASTTVAVAEPPLEGEAVELDALRGRWHALGDDQKAWLNHIRAEALAAGVDIHLAGHPTARRARIMDGLLTLAEAELDVADTVRACVHAAIRDDVAEWESVPVGAVVGSMGATEAATFVAACEALALGSQLLIIEADGRPTLRAAA